MIEMSLDRPHAISFLLFWSEECEFRSLLLDLNHWEYVPQSLKKLFIPFQAPCHGLFNYDDSGVIATLSSIARTSASVLSV